MQSVSDWWKNINRLSENNCWKQLQNQEDILIFLNMKHDERKPRWNFITKITFNNTGPFYFEHRSSGNGGDSTNATRKNKTRKGKTVHRDKIIFTWRGLRGDLYGENDLLFKRFVLFILIQSWHVTIARKNLFVSRYFANVDSEKCWRHVTEQKYFTNVTIS